MLCFRFNEVQLVYSRNYYPTTSNPNPISATKIRKLNYLNMKTPDFYKDKRAGTISDLMLFAIAADQPKYIEIDDFLRIAFGYAKEIFPHENKFNSRRSDEVNLVKALTYITYTKYRKDISLQSMGREIAKVIGRNKPFDHASILAKLKEHVKAATFNYGYEVYMARYTKFVGKLRSNYVL